jgi:hypothetical protein
MRSGGDVCQFVHNCKCYIHCLATGDGLKVSKVDVYSGDVMW